MSKKKDRKDAPNESYEVGFKKPPIEHQFPSGRSGNPKGRPKGSKGMLAIFQEELDRKVPVTSGGVQRTVQTRRLVSKAVLREASKGSIRHAEFVMRLDAAFQKTHREEPKKQAETDLNWLELCKVMTSEELQLVIRCEAVMTGLHARVAQRESLPLPSDFAEPAIRSVRTECQCEDPHLGHLGDAIARTVIACRQCGRLLNAQYGGPIEITIEQMMALTWFELAAVINAGAMLKWSSDAYYEGALIDPRGMTILDDDDAVHQIVEHQPTVGETLRRPIF